jgi:hypothetical protein
LCDKDLWNRKVDNEAKRSQPDVPSAEGYGAPEKANIPPDKIDETVRSLSAHLGWDITRGANPGPTSQ